ncbi:glycosyltransferase family 4 protein [Flavobacteriaceae bacterium]|nr:glycosyltransferase family 4 protein [Flavobacteriaceae bacterium]
MRIGIDCLDINPQYAGGVNSYLFGLMEGFSSIERDDIDFVILCCPANKFFLEPIAKKHNFALVNIKFYNKFIYTLFLVIPFIFNSKSLWRIFTNIHSEIFGVNKTFQKKCDIVYTASTVLNSYNLKIPTILSMHDIQHVHFPEFFSKIRLRVRLLRFENSALAATKIQASSNFIKEDLLDFFKFLIPEKIIVITEGVNLKEFSEPTVLNIKKKYSLPEKFLFFPATLWKHKNHLLVLNALKLIEEKHKIKIPLILTGGRNTAYEEIMSFISNNNMDYVKYLGKVSYEEIIALYQNAYCLVTAVLYESSSLPILEAAASGLPIIASNTPPNKEMGKILNLNLFESDNLDNLELQIINNWRNIKIQDQKNFNLKKIDQYSWKNIASDYLSNFESIFK